MSAEIQRPGREKSRDRQSLGSRTGMLREDPRGPGAGGKQKGDFSMGLVQSPHRDGSEGASHVMRTFHTNVLHPEGGSRGSPVGPGQEEKLFSKPQRGTSVAPCPRDLLRRLEKGGYVSVPIIEP